MYQNLTSNISQSHPHISLIFVSFSIKLGTLNSKMKWKPEPEVVFRAILVKNQISGFSRPRISAIHLCSVATRWADRSVDRRRFGLPSSIGNRTATPRWPDSDQAECIHSFIYKKRLHAGLQQACIASLVKHLSPYTGHISLWIALSLCPLAHKKMNNGSLLCICMGRFKWQCSHVDCLLMTSQYHHCLQILTGCSKMNFLHNVYFGFWYFQT